MFSTNLGINFNTFVRFGIIDKTPPTPKKVPLKFVPDPKKTPCKKRVKHLLGMVILNTLLRRWLYTPNHPLTFGDWNGDWIPIGGTLGPQNHQKCRFYTPKIWVITPQNEGNVGSHGTNQPPWKLFSIFPTWPPTWKYDVAPPVEGSKAAFEVAAARWFNIQPVDGWLDILTF